MTDNILIKQYYMFKIKYKKSGGLNCEKRNVSNLSNRVFLCQEIKCSEVYKALDIKLNKRLTKKDITVDDCTDLDTTKITDDINTNTNKNNDERRHEYYEDNCLETYSYMNNIFNYG